SRSGTPTTAGARPRRRPAPARASAGRRANRPSSGTVDDRLGAAAVAARAAVGPVLAACAGQVVAAGQPEEPVVARPAIEGVRPRSADDHVGVLGADHDLDRLEPVAPLAGGRSLGELHAHAVWRL